VVTFFLHATKSAPQIPADAARYAGTIPLAKQTAMTAMAPKSSTVASVRRNAATAGGMRFLKKL